MKKLTAFVLVAVFSLAALGCNRQAQETVRETPLQAQPTVETLPPDLPTEEPLPPEQPTPETLPCVQLPEDRSQPVELPEGLAQYVSDLTKCIQWREDTSHCEGEYLFCIDGKQFLYHDVCGTFRDPQSNQCAQVSYQVRNRLNKFLGYEPSYPPLSDKKYNVEVIDEYNFIRTTVAPSYSPGQVVEIELPRVADCVVHVYVNGMLTEQKTLTKAHFIMPCEDILIEVKMISIFH